MANSLAVTLHASGAETATGTGAAIDIGAGRSCVVLDLLVTVVSTDDDIVLTVDTSPDGTTGWRTIGEGTYFSAVGKESLVFAGCDRYVRAAWTISGTSPSITFAVTGEAHALYADQRDLDRTLLDPDALKDIDWHIKNRHLLDATDTAEAYIAASYTMPLSAWPHVVRTKVAQIATASLLDFRGLDPEGGDEMVMERAKDAERWLKQVADGKLRPPGIIDATPTVYEGPGVVATSAPLRGW